MSKIWNACGEAFDRFTTATDSYSDNIERPAIEPLMGDLAGARVLDLGCGSGTYSTWLAGRGAQVIGLDLSPVMIALAAEKARERNVRLDLAVADIGKPLPFKAGEFDLVFTSTALHYIKDLGSAIKEASRVMKAGARFIASVLHPVSTAHFPTAGTEEVGDRDRWEISYFDSPRRIIKTPWVNFGDVPAEGRFIFSYHHTTAEYFAAFSAANLAITDLREPRPPADFAAVNISRYKEAMRVPVYLIICATSRRAS